LCYKDTIEIVIFNAKTQEYERYENGNYLECNCYSLCMFYEFLRVTPSNKHQFNGVREEKLIAKKGMEPKHQGYDSNCQEIIQ